MEQVVNKVFGCSYEDISSTALEQDSLVIVNSPSQYLTTSVEVNSTPYKDISLIESSSVPLNLIIDTNSNTFRIKSSTGNDLFPTQVFESYSISDDYVELTLLSGDSVGILRVSVSNNLITLPSKVLDSFRSQLTILSLEWEDF